MEMNWVDINRKQLFAVCFSCLKLRFINTDDFYLSVESWVFMSVMMVIEWGVIGIYCDEMDKEMFLWWLWLNALLFWVFPRRILSNWTNFESTYLILNLLTEQLPKWKIKAEKMTVFPYKKKFLRLSYNSTNAEGDKKEMMKVDSKTFKARLT